MKFARLVLLSVFAFVFSTGMALAKMDTVELYTNAVMTGDIPVLEKILAPNYWYIGGNGHIQDKEHFIAEIRDKKLVVDRLSLSNMRETKIGETRLLTFNGIFYGKAENYRPQGLMRFTMVLADNNGQEQVVLFQTTPVIASDDCKDGNCRIK